MIPIDVEKLFLKYINHVIDCEGSDFIIHIRKGESSEEFTQEEIDFIENLGSDHK